MRRMVRTAAAATAAAALIAGAPAVSAAADASGGQGVTVGFALADASDSYDSAELKALTDWFAARGGVTVVTMDAGGDSTKQTSQLHQLAEQKVDGIFLQALDGNSFISGLQEAADAGIPVIGLDTEVSDMSYLTSFAAMNEYKAGQLAAQELLKDIPAGGMVLILDHPDSAAVTARIAGFTDRLTDPLAESALEPAETPFTVAGESDGGGSRDAAKEAAKTLFGQYSGCTALIAGDDQMALGAADAAQEAGLDGLKIYGFGGSPDMKKAMADGNAYLAGTAASSPVTLGQAAAEMMDGYLDGKKLNARYLIDPFMISASGAGQYGTDGWQ